MHVRDARPQTDPQTRRPPDTADVTVLGGGSAGLAAALAVSHALPDSSVVVVDGRRRPDPRTWCFWDFGENPFPEAVVASWTRWEIRTPSRAVVAGDPRHPYRMISAAGYRDAAARRLELRAGARLVSGTRVDAVEGRAGGYTTTTDAGAISSPVVLDGRGPESCVEAQPGSALLHQRFLGHWIQTSRPVFSTDTVTLMDFTQPADEGEVHFFYVLPVSATEALVESTVFASSSSSAATSASPRDRIASYVAARWGLASDEWSVSRSEAGDIAMTDASPGPSRLTRIGVRAGATRPSTGYAFSRIQRHAQVVARAVGRGEEPSPVRDPLRTRLLDAVFLRFLRDQPERAPEVFARLFGSLPGPVTVRFLTEHSTVLDEVRLVAALPKAPFLLAAWTTLLEKIRALR